MLKEWAATDTPKFSLKGHLQEADAGVDLNKRWFDNIKHFYKEADIPTVTAAGQLASNRDQWRLIVVGKPSLRLASGGRL